MVRENSNQVLIVDDEPDMCWALDQLLKQNGILSVKASNGREALELIGRTAFPLAFLDAKLPDVEGLELARQMRDIDPAVRIVMVSGYFYSNDAAIEDALTEGLINAFVAKPFSHDEILDVVRPAVTL